MTPALAAARRLAETLPVREHRIMDDQGAPPARGASVAVIVAGRHYASIGAAAKALRRSRHLVQRMLDDGDNARYA